MDKQNQKIKSTHKNINETRKTMHRLSFEKAHAHFVHHPINEWCAKRNYHKEKWKKLCTRTKFMFSHRACDKCIGVCIRHQWYLSKSQSARQCKAKKKKKWQKREGKAINRQQLFDAFMKNDIITSTGDRPKNVILCNINLKVFKIWLSKGNFWMRSFQGIKAKKEHDWNQLASVDIIVHKTGANTHASTHNATWWHNVQRRLRIKRWWKMQ